MQHWAQYKEHEDEQTERKPNRKINIGYIDTIKTRVLT